MGRKKLTKKISDSKQWTSITQTHMLVWISGHIKQQTPIKSCIVWANCEDKQLFLGDFSFLPWMSQADQVSVTFKEEGARNWHTHGHKHLRTHTHASTNIIRQRHDHQQQWPNSQLQPPQLYLQWCDAFFIWHSFLTAFPLILKSWLIHCKGNRYIITIF